MSMSLQASPPVHAPLRLRLNTGGDGILLDGGWWPRSTRPDAELPALIIAIDRLHGPVRRMALGADAWSTRPRQITVDTRTIHIGYFASQPASLLTALCDSGRRVDLLVVAPDTDASAALAAMDVAATSGNPLHAQQITAAAVHDGLTPAEHLAQQVWESEGGDPHHGARIALRPALPG